MQNAKCKMQIIKSQHFNVLRFSFFTLVYKVIFRRSEILQVSICARPFPNSYQVKVMLCIYAKNNFAGL